MIIIFFNNFGNHTPLIKKVIQILEYQFSHAIYLYYYHHPSLSSINNIINIENVINKNNMMIMNVSAASYHPDIHAGSSSHSQEPPSQMINVDE
jgi:hypothetical protein